MNKAKIIGAWLLASSMLVAQASGPHNGARPKDAPYTPEQVERFRQMEGRQRDNILFVDVSNFAALSEQERSAEFEKQIDTAMKRALWSDTKAAELMTRLKEHSYSKSASNERLIVDKAAFAPYSTPLIGSSGHPFAADTLSIVLLPGDPVRQWALDTDAWREMTNLNHPERPFPSAEETHAFLIGHESFHATDPHTVGWHMLDAMNKATTEDTRDVETDADVGSAQRFVGIYKDPSFLPSLMHARAIQAVYDGGDHATSSALQKLIKPSIGTKVAPSLTRDEEGAGHTKIAIYLSKKAGVDPDSPGFFTLRDLEPGAIYGALVQGLKKGEIKDRSAAEVAQRFIGAYEYFEPSQARAVRKALFPKHLPRSPSSKQVASHSQQPQP